MMRALLWLVRTWRRVLAPTNLAFRILRPRPSRHGATVVILSPATPIEPPPDLPEAVRDEALRLRRRFEQGELFDPLRRAAQSGGVYRTVIVESYAGEEARHLVVVERSVTRG